MTENFSNRRLDFCSEAISKRLGGPKAGALRAMAAEEAIGAIHRAAVAGEAEGVARMLDEDPRLLSSEWGGQTLLTHAAREGRAGVLRLLLERGSEINSLNEYGNTALHLAAWSGHEEVVSLLITSGADITMRGEGGGTALMDASDRGHVAVVRLLLRSMRGHGLDDRDDIERTALWMACCRGHVDVVRALLLAGADHTIASHRAWTPERIAQQCRHPQCVSLLQWWEYELQRAYVLHRARALYDDTATRQHAPAGAVPAYLSTRVQEGKRLPRVQIQGSGCSEGPRTRGAAKRGAEGGEKKEEEIRAMVGYVVKDLDGHLYTELMQGLRLR